MLTPAQKTAIKTYVLANLANLTDRQIALALNATASPDYWVWRTSISEADATNVSSVDATNFGWTEFISRNQGERDCWRQLFGVTGTVNASNPNVRQAFADIFSGPSGAANRTHLLAIARRKATLGEKILATGTGSTASPATMGKEGELSAQDVIDSLNS